MYSWGIEIQSSWKTGIPPIHQVKGASPVDEYGVVWYAISTGSNNSSQSRPLLFTTLANIYFNVLLIVPQDHQFVDGLLMWVVDSIQLIGLSPVEHPIETRLHGHG